MAESFEARYSPFRSLRLVLVSLLFCAGGLYVAGAFGEFSGSSNRVPEWAIPIVGWLCAAMAGGFAMIQLRNAAMGGVAISIDSFGIYASALSAERIPWRDINDVRPVTVAGSKFVLVDVSDNSLSIGRPNPGLKGKNYADGWLIAMDNTNRSADEVVEAAVSLRK